MPRNLIALVLASRQRRAIELADRIRQLEEKSVARRAVDIGRRTPKSLVFSDVQQEEPSS